MNTVPKTLRTLFVVHFLADISFALPLLFIPKHFQGMLVTSIHRMMGST